MIIYIWNYFYLQGEINELRIGCGNSTPAQEGPDSSCSVHGLAGDDYQGSTSSSAYKRKPVIGADILLLVSCIIICSFLIVIFLVMNYNIQSIS